jgi:hypothetical protein
MGKPSGRLLLDLDFRNGGPKDRMAVVDRYGEIPATSEVDTPGPGRHIYFLDPGGRVPAHLAKGIDLKSTGGYSVLPPSVHPNGSRYAFARPATQESLLHVAEIPAWLASAIAAKPTASSKTGQAPPGAAVPDKWPHGERNSRLASFAGKLRHAGSSVSAIEAALIAENELRCDPPLPVAEVWQIAASIGRYPAGKENQSHAVAPSAAVIDLGRFQPSLELLNGLTVWRGLIQFVSIRRRGPMIIASTSKGAEVVWPSTAELGNFSKTQAIVSDSANIWIPTPPHRQIRTQWEPAVSLLLQLSAEDSLRLEPALKEEIRGLMRLVWRAADQPVAENSDRFIAFMRAIDCARRNPKWGLDDSIDASRRVSASKFPPCVFVAEEAAWVHVPTFRLWLSIPALTNHQPPLADVRNGLLLLGFTYCENLTRGKDGDSETACLWRGPLEVLEG